MGVSSRFPGGGVLWHRIQTKQHESRKRTENSTSCESEKVWKRRYKNVTLKIKAYESKDARDSRVGTENSLLLTRMGTMGPI